MKNIVFILLVIFVGCSFDAYTPSENIALEDNVFYSLESDGTISGDLFYYDDSMKSKYLTDSFEYSCRTSTPSIIFQSYGSYVTITLEYNGIVYTESGGGTLIITVK